MLRSEINSNIAENCSEQFGTTGEASAVFAYQKLVSDACDTHSRKTRCYWQVSNLPIIANQARYGAPDILEMQCITVFTADGNIHLVDPANEPAMDDWGGSTWRSQTAGTQPLTIITQGLNSFLLSPAPSFSSSVYSYVDMVLGSTTDANGNAVSTASSVARPFTAADVNLFVNVTGGTGFTAGWYRIVSVAGGVATLLTTAGTAGSVAGAGVLTSGGLWVEGPGVPGQTWENPGDTCPLPDRAHMGVVWLASMQRIISSRTLSTGEKQWRYAMCKENYEEHCGMLEREARTITYASRVPSLIGSAGAYAGAWDSTFGNPLNM